MDIDEFYMKSGSEFGTRQKFWFGLLNLFNFYAPFHMIQVVFIGPVPQFQCTIGNETYNNSCVPLGTEAKCDRIIYDPFMDSFVKEWSPSPCKSDLAQLVQMAFMLGVMVGALTLGAAADALGRKPILLFSLLGMIGFGAASSFVPTFIYFAGLRFIIGVCTAGNMISCFVLAGELVGPSVRGFCGNLFQFSFAIGIMGYVGLAYLIHNDWRMLTLACALVGLSLVTIAAFVPESPRWLYANGKAEMGLSVLKRLTRTPGSDFQILAARRPPARQSSVSNGRITMFTMFRVKPMMVVTQVFSWFVNSIVYYALTLSAHSLGANVYISTFLSGLVELPAYVLTGLVIDRVGRKVPLALFMVIAGVSCICCQFVPSETISLYLALLGKLCIAGSFSIIYIHSSELFPTVVRNSGVGLCSSSARVGGVVASYFVAGSSSVWEMVALGGLAVSSGLLNLTLPETLNHKLPETLEDLSRTSSTTVLGGPEDYSRLLTDDDDDERDEEDMEVYTHKNI